MSTPSVNPPGSAQPRLEPPHSRERAAEPRAYAATPFDPDQRELTFGALFVVVVRNRVLIAIVVAVAVAISLIMIALTPRTWSSAAKLLPQKPAQAGAISGFAAQFGLGGASGGDAMQSPAFYVELVRYRAILGQIVDSARIPQASGRDVSVPEALGLKTGNPRAVREGAMSAVSSMIHGSVAARTGVVTFNVMAEDPDMAVGVAEGVIAALTRFNSEVRQSSAASERQFIERRRAETRAERTGAEETLRDFLRRNRGGLDSPDIQFERQRLMTEVELRRDLYASLSQAYERARMEEVRDTPVLTVIDRPERPLGPDQKGGQGSVLLALFGGLFAGIVLAFLVESVRNARSH